MKSKNKEHIKLIVVAKRKLTPSDQLVNQGNNLRLSYLSFSDDRAIAKEAFGYSLHKGPQEAMIFESNADASANIQKALLSWSEHKELWEKKIEDIKANGLSYSGASHQTGSKRTTKVSMNDVKISTFGSLKKCYIDDNTNNLDNYELSIEPLSAHYKEVFLGLTLDHYLYLRKIDNLDEVVLWKTEFLPINGISFDSGYKMFPTAEDAEDYTTKWIAELHCEMGILLDHLEEE